MRSAKLVCGILTVTAAIGCAPKGASTQTESSKNSKSLPQSDEIQLEGGLTIKRTFSEDDSQSSGDKALKDGVPIKVTVDGISRDLHCGDDMAVLKLVKNIYLEAPPSKGKNGKYMRQDCRDSNMMPPLPADVTFVSPLKASLEASTEGKFSSAEASGVSSPSSGGSSGFKAQVSLSIVGGQGALFGADSTTKACKSFDGWTEFESQVRTVQSQLQRVCAQTTDQKNPENNLPPGSSVNGSQEGGVPSAPQGK